MAKYTDEKKLEAVKAYRKGTGGLRATAETQGVQVDSLRKWVAGYSALGAAGVVTKKRGNHAVASMREAAAFIPIALAREPAPEAVDIRIELHRGPLLVNVTWPVASALHCAAWDARSAQVIQVDALWLAVEPLNMRTGTESALARVVQVFGSAHPHHAYLFANRRGNRMKVLVHDGIGVWLAARRLNQGKFVWPKTAEATLGLSRAQFDALILGLPWQRLGAAGIIRVL